MMSLLPSCRVVIASLSSLYSLSPMSLVAFTLNWYDVKGFSLRDGSTGEHINLDDKLQRWILNLLRRRHQKRNVISLRGFFKPNTRHKFQSN